jgi:hypothetical protein
MSNRAYLLNTSLLTSDPYLLAASLNEPGNDFVAVAEGAYKIPIPWFLCFRPEDIRPVRVPLEGDIENGNAAAGGIEVGLPCTSVKQALKNMAQALPVFESIAGDSKLGKMFWQNAMTYLQGMPLTYLTMDPTEVMFMLDPLPYAQLILAAIGGNQAAIESMVDLSCYEKGVLPYPPDVLYAVSGDNRDEVRMQNCVALDIGYGNFWHDSAGSKGVQRAELPLHILSPAAAPNLRTLSDEVEALANTRIKSASVHLSFTSRMATQCEQLKMLISADTDAECNALVNDIPFRNILDGSIHTKLNMVCQNYGFSWVGYVIRSDESVKRRFKGDYSVYNDWISMPVEKSVIY